MKLAKLTRLLAVIALANAAAMLSAAAQALDKVSFGTNWVAEAEHGGFYQAVADGTYRRYGLDVTIVPGGPQVNNRILVPVGKMDFVDNRVDTATGKAMPAGAVTGLPVSEIIDIATWR